MTIPDYPHLIAEQYGQYPYPSPPEPGKNYPELANLLKLFQLDSGCQLTNKRILDAGTGTGVRLLELAKSYPENNYFGIDQSINSISVANAMKQKHQQHNIDFQVMDMHQLNPKQCGMFDYIFCMGVLHHLENPMETLQRLSGLLKQDGGLFFYVYGRYGSSERIRRKQILYHLCGDHPIDQKIATAKCMGFTDFPYGWELRNQRDVDAMLVDAYVNEFEVLYTLESIDRIVPHECFSSWVPYGFALEKYGVLVESRISAKRRLPLKSTTPTTYLPTPALERIYQDLPKLRQLLLLEDWYQPSGYTVLLHNHGLLSQVTNPERFTENEWAK